MMINLSLIYLKMPGLHAGRRLTDNKRTGNSPLQVNLCSGKISGSYSLLFQLSDLNLLAITVHTEVKWVAH